ncbi:MAG: glycosyltransferase [Prevotellaceae bacterium]|nr:glycosyltransferase [Prevotellaceae bacterium]
MEIVRRAIESVAVQTYPNIELILVNDYPEDSLLVSDLGKLAKKYNERLHVNYIVHEHNKGACAARNTGITNSTGEYIAFLDDDDEWYPTKIEKMVEVLSKNDKTGLVYSSYVIRSKSGDTEIRPPVFQDDWFIQLLGQNFIGSTSFPALKRECIISAGMFDVKMKSMQDWDMWLRVAKIADIAFIDEPLTLYNVEEESISTNVSNKISGHKRMLDKYSDDYESHKKQRSIRYDVMAHDLYKYGEKEMGKECLKKGIIAYPFLLRHLKELKYMFLNRQGKHSK